MITKPTLYTIKQSRFLLLLIAILFVLLISPFLDDQPSHKSYLVALNALVLLSAARMSATRSRSWFVALATTALWAVLGLYGIFLNDDHANILSQLIFIASCTYIAWIILVSIVASEHVDFDLLLGSIAIYLIIGLLWAVSYSVIFTLDPKSFSLISGESQPPFHQFIYFSLATLTTVGYGDITPRMPFPQVWSTLEAVVGTLYMAVLVARLVSIYQPSHPRRH